jgi:indole-3-glycerol phosphate synthase
MTAPATADLLAAIVAAARRVVEVRSQREPPAALAKRAEAAVRPGGRFLAAVGRSERINVIAECKRRSPSRGVLRADYDPVAIARAYERAGAAAISVLTEPTFFDGAIDHLVAVRTAVDVPLLRKDFIVSEYQLLEAAAAGADAVLLIAAALERKELRSLLARATSLGLDALVEAHDAREIAAAVDAGASIVGVNNRNLRTLDVDVDLSERLVSAIPPEVVAIAESGLKSAEDVVRLRALGYRAFLVGERFMTERDPGETLGNLLERANARLKPRATEQPT